MRFFIHTAVLPLLLTLPQQPAVTAQINSSAKRLITTPLSLSANDLKAMLRKTLKVTNLRRLVLAQPLISNRK
jgi:hypothetical protein